MNFLEKYNNKKNIRFNFFKKTLEIAKNRDLKTIVETGTSRGKKKFGFKSNSSFKRKDGISSKKKFHFKKHSRRGRNRSY